MRDTLEKNIRESFSVKITMIKCSLNMSNKSTKPLFVIVLSILLNGITTYTFFIVQHEVQFNYPPSFK